ncbi:MAG: hypothetical protein JO022_17660 [Acidobacteriaceae bacterium]|nr:hypothetical protein [Acidobacteriaceae bacterium]
MSKQLAIFMGIGLVLVICVIAAVFVGTKGAHLELNGQVLKARTGELDEKRSIAVLDFRISNPSNVLFVVRDVKVTLETAQGQKIEGLLVPKMNLKQVFDYNRFLGQQYNDALSIKDRVPAHGQIDRMVAASFDVPAADLEGGKTITLYIQDMDGAEFETVYKLPPR